MCSILTVTPASVPCDRIWFDLVLSRTLKRIARTIQGCPTRATKRHIFPTDHHSTGRYPLSCNQSKDECERQGEIHRDSVRIWHSATERAFSWLSSSSVSCRPELKSGRRWVKLAASFLFPPPLHPFGAP